MATATQANPALVTMEEYLHTAYSPDCDFVDGRIEERNMGEVSHSLLQGELVFWFRSQRDAWNIRVMPEYRMRVSERHVRVPDVSVAYNDEAMRERVRQTPLLIAIEILSPEDRLSRVAERLADFLAMGVQNIWLLDPETRVAYSYLASGLTLVVEPRLTVPNTPIYLDLADVFACLD